MSGEVDVVRAVAHRLQEDQPDEWMHAVGDLLDNWATSIRGMIDGEDEDFWNRGTAARVLAVASRYADRVPFVTTSDGGQWTAESVEKLRSERDAAWRQRTEFSSELALRRANAMSEDSGQAAAEALRDAALELMVRPVAFGRTGIAAWLRLLADVAEFEATPAAARPADPDQDGGGQA